nr:calmodulin-like [Coffea arabica]XP_027108156.1 calmodulin-like [Coffea arabica]XP_027108158.1 calmodulin-like [Coffea arabica]XP_027108159.1 calmodulin-like [Coffea arabica]
MLDSLKMYLKNSALIKSVKFSFLNQFRSWKRRRSKELDADLSWLTASFAAMEVSNQLKQVFKIIDKNGDGKISPLELSEVLLSLGHEKSLATTEAEGMVREMDCDGDGFVDLDEFMNVMGADESERVASFLDREDDLAEAFQIFDADKNGFISAKELQRVLISLGCQNCSLRECRRMIKGVDRDGDGSVNFQEFKSMMSAGCSRN